MTKPNQSEAHGHEVIAKPGLIEIFRAGKHTASDGTEVTFTQADIATIAANYDPNLSEAPIVVGHPETNAPAYGWAKRLVAQGPLLLAEPHQLDDAFTEMANAGRFKKKSASIFMPNTPGNPTPGKHYLRHIGYLGAAVPAVKGLRDARFADGSEHALEFSDWSERNAFGAIADLFTRIREFFIERDGVEVIDKTVPDWQINQVRDAARPSSDAAIPSNYADPSATATEELTMSDPQKAADFAAKEEALAKSQKELTDREAAIAKREIEARRADCVNFADGLVKAGKLLPRQKAGAIELLLAIAPDQVLNFAAPEAGAAEIKKPAAEVLRELLTGMPAHISFTERSAGDETSDAAVSFAAPAGVAVDTSKSDLYAKAKAHQARNPALAWLDCVRAVGG
jgi:hypothetical protein